MHSYMNLAVLTLAMSTTVSPALSAPGQFISVMPEYEWIPILLAMSLIFVLVPERTPLQTRREGPAWFFNPIAHSKWIPILLAMSFIFMLVPGNGTSCTPAPFPKSESYRPLPLRLILTIQLGIQTGMLTCRKSCVHFILHFCPFWWQVSHFYPFIVRKWSQQTQPWAPWATWCPVSYPSSYHPVN